MSFLARHSLLGIFTLLTPPNCSDMKIIMKGKLPSSHTGKHQSNNVKKAKTKLLHTRDNRLPRTHIETSLNKYKSFKNRIYINLSPLRDTSPIM